MRGFATWILSIPYKVKKADVFNTGLFHKLNQYYPTGVWALQQHYR